MPRSERAEHPNQPQRDVFSTVKKEMLQFEKTGAFQPRALPALRLYTYNFFRKNPTPTEVELGIYRQTCREVNELESVRATEAASGSPLPTIGTEIEWFIPQEHRETLERLESLGRKNDPKVGLVPGIDEDPTGPLWELNLPWTYAAQTQAFMIAKLAEMGMFNPAFGEGQAQQTIGMHLNFGAPSDIAADQLTDQLAEERIEDVSDALVISYTSAQRLQDRKTHYSYSARKETEESKPKPTEKKVYRLELRAFEITQDMDMTERLLLESQYVVSGLFQWIRMRVPFYHDLLSINKSIAESFGMFSGGIGDFRGDVHELKEALGIPDNFADKDRAAATAQVTNKDTVRAFQTLVTNTSNTLKGFIHPTDEEE